MKRNEYINESEVETNAERYSGQIFYLMPVHHKQTIQQLPGCESNSSV
jgi:hypothetical protein